MKSEIKRFLFVSMSLALAALAVRRSSQEAEIEAETNSRGTLQPVSQPEPGPQLDSGLSDPNPGFGTPAQILGDQGARMLPRRPASPMVAPTVIFSGTVVRSGPHFALRETAGDLYPLDSAGRAWPFEGEDVRVTGKLDLDTRLLYVDAIEPAVML
jgi:hypothetical protein